MGYGCHAVQQQWHCAGTDCRHWSSAVRMHPYGWLGWPRSSRADSAQWGLYGKRVLWPQQDLQGQYCDAAAVGARATLLWGLLEGLILLLLRGGLELGLPSRLLEQQPGVCGCLCCSHDLGDYQRARACYKQQRRPRSPQTCGLRTCGILWCLQGQNAYTRTRCGKVAIAQRATRRYGVPEGMNGGQVQAGTADGMTSTTGSMYNCAVGVPLGHHERLSQGLCGRGACSSV